MTNIEADCSRAFSNIGKDYYVFGNLDNTGEEIVMNDFPGFVPDHHTLEMNNSKRFQ